MSSLRDTLERLLAAESLTESEAAALLTALTDPALPPAMAGGLLTALRAKGVTGAELRGFASGMRRLARRPEIGPGAPLLDIVGTGGDGSNSFNLSTGSALLAAAVGVRIAKHGNRSLSSRCGSADVLEALGLQMPIETHAVGQCLADTGFTFLFAPHFHPAMKALAPVRQALGIRTVLNLLGPLTNPAEPAYALIGAHSLPTARLLADALSGMPIERAFVVHGEQGWDEPTPLGPFVVFDVRPGQVRELQRDPEEFAIPRCQPEDLLGGDAAYNARALRAVFAGEDRGAHRDALVLGTALALELVGAAPSALEARYMAEAGIDSGRARALLERLAQFRAQSQVGG
jgi:anthranilate phosphoribosyltransferase